MKHIDKEDNKAKSDTRICVVTLLNGQEFTCNVPRKADGSFLLNQIRELLDIIEFDYFGLSFEDSTHQKYWLEGEKSIKKQLKNSRWLFNFAVKFYPSDPSQLAEDIVRYYMVLQLRDSIVSGILPCSFVTHALLGSYVVQSELGDYDSASMKNNYVEGFQFAPNQTSKLEENVMELHKKRSGLTPEQAETGYLENVKKLHFYGVDLHPVKDSENVSLVLGVSWNGLRVYRDQTQINRFAWPRILKICYSRTKFYIKIRQVNEKSDESIIGFKVASHREAKKLWKACVEHHTFFRLTKPDVRKSKVLRTGSKFRYSGLTQHQTRQSVASANRKYSPKITRTASRKSPSFASRDKPVIAIRTSKSATSSEDGISPPALPKKEHVVTSETVTVTEEIIEIEEKVKPIPVATETTVTETVVTVQEVETPIARSSSSSSGSSYSDDGSDILTKHQKKVHKLKPQTIARDGTEETKGEFLERPHSGSTASDWDIRLKSSPTKSKETADSKSVDGRYVSQEDEKVTDNLDVIEQHAKSEEVSVVSTVLTEVVVTEVIETKSSQQEHDNDSSSTSSEGEVDPKEEIVYKPLNEEPLPDFFPAEERKESSNSSSSSSSSEDQEEEEETNAGEELEHETTIQHNFVQTTVLVNNHAAESDEICEPKQADEDNALEDGPNNLAGSHSSLSSKSSSKSSSSSAAEEVSFENLPEDEERKSPMPVDEEQNENNNNNEGGDKIPDLQEEGDAADIVVVLPHHKITTVETKSVRVEEAVIPRTEYEVRKVALTADQDNNVTEKVTCSTSSSSSSSSSSDSEDDLEYAEEGSSPVVNGFKKPPIVETETVVVEPVEDDEPELTNEPPVVQTETKTITYESTVQQPEVTFLAADISGDTQLISSQTITAETMSSVTTTHITKTVVGSVSETRVEKSIVITADGEANLHQAMAEMILDTQENNPDVSITKVVVQEEKVIGNP